MEAVGLAASIIAILQLTGKVISVGYSYVSGVKRAPKDVRELLDELSALAKVLETLQDYVNANPQSPALQTLNGQDGPLQGIRRELEELYNKLDGKSTLVDRLKWPLKEKETAQTIVRVERHKTLFIFALTADQISLTKEIEAYARDTDLNVQEIKANVYSLKADFQYTNLAIQSLQSESAAQKSWREREITAHEAAKRKSVLNWLYPSAVDPKHIEVSDARQKNTGGWLLKSSEIQEWVKKNPFSPILWGYGIPGAGKTFLSSAVIDHLQELAPTANYGVAYIYFDYKEQDQQLPIHILASLLKQLLSQLTHLPNHINHLHAKLEPHGRRPNLEELYSALMSTMPAFSQVFFVFDALDECSQKKQRKGLLPLFQRMGQSGIHVFITSREYPEDIQDSLRHAARVELSANGQDIRYFIEQKIEENPRAKRLVKQGKLKDIIISDLTECAKGMFLLVHFHIEYLCEMTNVRLIMRALDNLRASSNKERPLDPTYDRAVNNILTQAGVCRELGLKILSWLVNARRTLTVDELREAVAVEQGRYELDEWDWTDKATLLDVCAGLVMIDEKSETIRLVHYTVHEYLLLNSVLPKDANYDIAMVCLTYLSFDVFAEPARGLYAIVHRVQRYPFLAYASQHLNFHIKECDETLTRDPLLKLLENPGHILSYAQGRVYVPGTSSALYPEQPALHIASFLGHNIVVQLLLDKGADIEAVDSHGGRALHMAVLEKHETTVELLLKNGANISSRDKVGATILHTASWAGNEAVFQLLLDKGADISLRDDSGNTALRMAAGARQNGIVQILLDRGSEIMAVDNDGSTALHAAAWVGNNPTIQLLIDRGANISAQDNWGYTALHTAASLGHPLTVGLLLDNGADIEAQDNNGCTPLNRAVWMGREAAAQFLIDRGANMFARSHGRTILDTAVSASKLGMVQLLLRNGVNPTLLAEYGDRLLSEEVFTDAQAGNWLMDIVGSKYAPLALEPLPSDKAEKG